jgi:hypothetical protein
MAILNPELAFGVVRRNGSPAVIHFAAPQKNGFLALCSVKDRLSELESMLLGGAAPPADVLEPLLTRQILVEPNEASGYPAYRPPIAGEATASVSAALDDVLRDSAGIEWSTGAMPATLSKRLPQAYHGLRFCLPGEQVLWSKDWLTQVWWPYVMRNEQAEEIKVRLAARPSSAPALPVTPHMGSSAAQGTHTTPALVAEVVPRLQQEALAAYFRRLRAEGCMRLGDRDSKQRAWMHNEKIARFFGLQFGGHVSALVGFDVAPLFSHFVSYLEGASLPLHFDKDPDAYSLSIQLGFYQDGRSVPNRWAFNVKQRHAPGYAAFVPRCGDGVLFHGESEAHYRDPIPAGCVSDVLLLHFTRCA